MMLPSEKCLNTIKFFEHCFLYAYPDPASALAVILRQRGLWQLALNTGKIPQDLVDTIKGDPWTIGWGATGPNVKYGVVWTQDQADADLEERTNSLALRMQSSMSRVPTQNQFDAMISFAYNVGIGAWRTSTLLKLFNAGDAQGAAAQFPRWNKAGGQVLAGLTKRREAEQKLFLGE